MTPSDYIPCEDCTIDPPNNAVHLFLSPGNYTEDMRAEFHWSSNMTMFTYRVCAECIKDDFYKRTRLSETIDRQDYLAAMAMAAL